MSQFIYLLRTRESMRIGEHIYKLGKTRKGLARLGGYPKGSELILMVQVPNCDTTEKALLAEFTRRYVQRRDHGLEYFEGNVDSMVNLLFERLSACRLHKSPTVINRQVSAWAVDTILREGADYELFGRHTLKEVIGMEHQSELALLSRLRYSISVRDGELVYLEEQMDTCQR
jgi:hypothetical protein